MLFILVGLFGYLVVGQVNKTLLFPPIISSEDGVLETETALESAIHSFRNSEVEITTRLFNGIYPGPTLRLKPGDELRINFTNNLSNQNLAYRENQLSAPDETNIHYHGLHVSGELPSDDTTLVLRPGEGYAYKSLIPFNHMGGTHWMHPHRHGSTALQVGGGALAAIIVEDSPGVLPAVVQSAREVLFIAHEVNADEMEQIAVESLDTLWTISGATETFVSVNGQINPDISVIPGEWVRFRVLWAGWLQGELDFEILGCEMQLLAKDGVYIRDFPRRIQNAPINPAGRADIMVRCIRASSTFTVTGSRGQMATLSTTADPVVQSSDLPSWSPEYPAYMADLRVAAASCGCSTSFDDGNVNGLSFDPLKTLHSSPLNAVVEREIDAGGHPYHQHVYPFQLVSGFEGNTAYNQIGDWHDTIQGDGLIRYQPNVFTGKIMVHCHRLIHEDRGMMAIEQVTESGECTCTAVPFEFPVWQIALIAVGAAVVSGGLIGVFFWFYRRRKR